MSLSVQIRFASRSPKGSLSSISICATGLGTGPLVSTSAIAPVGFRFHPSGPRASHLTASVSE
eukprot:7704712-Pyramimonas_sp.AAC.1